MIKARIPAQAPQDSNLGEYRQARRSFSWDTVRDQLGLSHPAALNICEYLISRHLESGRGHQTGLIFVQKEKVSRFSYETIGSEALRWAGIFREAGILPGDRVFFIAPSTPELYMAILGAIWQGAVVSPLYMSLGVGELGLRCTNGRPAAIVASPLMRDAISSFELPDLKAVIYIGDQTTSLNPKAASSFTRGSDPVPVMLSEDSPLYLIYTSGSTGPPKGVLHCHRDVLAYYSSGRYVLDLRPNDILWTDGPLPWVTGLVYGLFTPLLHGVPSVIQTGDFEPSLWYWTMEKHRVTVWYTTAMTLRRLWEAGLDLAKRYDTSSLRLILTVGEALGADLFYWAKEAFGLYPHDTWWMTETGSIAIANFTSMDLKPGSMGRPVPGIEALVVDERGGPLPPMSLGELALKTPWPSMLSGIFGEPERLSEYIRPDGLFRTGDMALMDEEGYLFHQGRVDDIIKIGDKMVGPFEVESILLDHPAVVEAAVISKTTVEKGTFMKAFVVLGPGYGPSIKLMEELKAFARANIALELPLKELEFIPRLPRTRAGKLLRRVLRAKELGLPLSD